MRRLALAILPAFFLLVGSVGAQPHVAGGCPVFPAYSGPAGASTAADETMWNQDVTNTPVLGQSYQTGGGNVSFRMRYPNAPVWNVVPSTQPMRNVIPESQAVFPYSDGSRDNFGLDFGQAPIPSDLRIEGEADPNTGNAPDGHALVVQRGTCQLYEMFRARRPGQGDHRWFNGEASNFDAATAAKWNLKSAAISSQSGVDAGGFPMFAGLIRPWEVVNGRWPHHVIRMSFGAGTYSGYIHPATRSAGSCNSALPPMGIRFRLSKAYFDAHLAEYPVGSQARAVFLTLYHYGGVNTDNGSSWTVNGATNGPASPNQFDLNDLSRLYSIPGSAFVFLRHSAPIVSGC